MTLLDAQEFDEKRSRKRKIIIAGVVFLILVLAWLGWAYRNWPEERVANQFFAALQKQDYEAAYGIYFADLQWKQHPETHSMYPLGEFLKDWGPGGEWGAIKSHRVYGAASCPGSSSGVVVDVIVNDRTQHAQVWVAKADKTISSPPCELLFR